MQLFLQFYADLLKTIQMFCHGLKMCMCCGYNPQIMLVVFVCILNLVTCGLVCRDCGYTTSPTVLHQFGARGRGSKPTAAVLCP